MSRGCTRQLQRFRPTSTILWCCSSTYLQFPLYISSFIELALNIPSPNTSNSLKQNRHFQETLIISISTISCYCCRAQDSTAFMCCLTYFTRKRGGEVPFCCERFCHNCLVSHGRSVFILFSQNSRSYAWYFLLLKSFQFYKENQYSSNCFCIFWNYEIFLMQFYHFTSFAIILTLENASSPPPMSLKH